MRVPVRDRRGDVLLAQNKLDEARTAYKEALDKAGTDHPLRGLHSVEVRCAAGARDILRR